MGRSPTDLAVFIGKRLLYLIPVVLGVMMITFFFTHIAVIDFGGCRIKSAHLSSREHISTSASPRAVPNKGARPNRTETPGLYEPP